MMMVIIARLVLFAFVVFELTEGARERTGHYPSWWAILVMVVVAIGAALPANFGQRTDKP